MGATEPTKRGRRAVFLDRDGVINRNVFYADTGQYESPRTAGEFALLSGVPEALKRLRGAGFLLFVVSNQPNYAKGKSTLTELEAIDAAFQREMTAIGIAFTAVYYCLHHPDGNVPGYSGPCVCRKPSPHFLLKAIHEFNLDAKRCWMVGDRPTDALCGLAAGVPAILIRRSNDEGGSSASYTAPDLDAASRLICAGVQPRTSHEIPVRGRTASVLGPERTGMNDLIPNSPEPHLHLRRMHRTERTHGPRL